MSFLFAHPRSLADVGGKGKCVVVVTHSKHLAEEADEILEIKNGAISFLSE